MTTICFSPDAIFARDPGMCLVDCKGPKPKNKTGLATYFGLYNANDYLFAQFHLAADDSCQRNCMKP